MGKTQCWMAVAVALAALAANPVEAQNHLYLTFRQGESSAPDTDKVRMNGSAKYVVGQGLPFGRIRLSDNSGQAGSFFIRTPFTLSDYELTFTFEVRRVSPGETPADGFTFVAQAGDNDEIGGSGGALGYARSDTLVLPSGARGGGIPGYSYAVEFNSWVSQGLPNAAETIGIDILGLRTRFNQTPLRFVDQGPMTAIIRVKPEGLSVAFATRQGIQTVLQSPGWMSGFFIPPRRLYFGFTAGTGGARQIVDIWELQLSSNQPLR
jgi:Legume lectin domain